MPTYTLFPSIIPATDDDGFANPEYRLTEEDILEMEWNDVQLLATHFDDCDANTRKGIAKALDGRRVPSYTFADD